MQHERPERGAWQRRVPLFGQDRDPDGERDDLSRMFDRRIHLQRSGGKSGRQFDAQRPVEKIGAKVSRSSSSLSHRSGIYLP